MLKTEDYKTDLINNIASLIGTQASQIQFERLNAGGNNRLFKVLHKRDCFIVKQYFAHPDDPRNRMQSEFSFLDYCKEAGIESVPAPLAKDSQNNIALYSYIEGETPDSVSAEMIDQAVEFIELLNKRKEKAAKINPASEACFSIDDHFHSFTWRLERLLRIKPESDIDKEALIFVKNKLDEEWRKVKKEISEKVNNTNTELPMNARCLSPSDFGFHNSLIVSDNEVYFFDFEYAGWDDPAKMICDFVCHPGHSVPSNMINRFKKSIYKIFKTDKDLQKRTELLIPVCILKWCCIILNEFLPVSKERRKFSNSTNINLDTQKNQLIKSQGLFNRLIRFNQDKRNI